MSLLLKSGCSSSRTAVLLPKKSFFTEREREREEGMDGGREGGRREGKKETEIKLTFYRIRNYEVGQKIGKT